MADKALKRLKKIFSFNPITTVPKALKNDFDKLRLAETIRRLKILCFIFVGIKILDALLALFGENRIPFGAILQVFGIHDYLDVGVFAAFIFLAKYFYQKNKRKITWLLCYLFVIYNAVISLLVVPPLGSYIHVLVVRSATAVGTPIVLEPQIVTISKVAELGDDVLIAIAGYIEEALGNGLYLFSDASGQIILEIEAEAWRRSHIDPAALQLPAQFQIIGEHDRLAGWGGIGGSLQLLLYVILLILTPVFLPPMFIAFSALYALGALFVFSQGYHSIFVYFPNIFFVVSIFLGILIIKILLYNGKVKLFINISEISALNQELISYNKKLEALSTTDELTNLNNRRAFLQYMDITWKQCQRLKLPISVMMIDIDCFKKYNDSMGHLEGDNALVAVAQCLKSQLKRDTDFVARYGGEEFICLLPYVEKTEALHFAEKLVQSIEAMKMPHPSSDYSKHITVSAGITSIIPCEAASKTELLDKADKALYVAKQSGRNRAVAN